MKNVVIVGGGFGGLRVAKALKKSDFSVTLIDKSNHHLFQPLLYQVATAALSPGDIAFPIRSIVGDQPNTRVLLGEVTEINKSEQFVALKNGDDISYDYLVLAPGAQYNYFGNENWKKHAPGLKSISNALQIRERILYSLEEAEQIKDPKKREKYLTYVVIGGGPTGVEMAGAIAEIAKRNLMRDYSNFSQNEIRIFLVEAGPSILNGYPESLQDHAVKTLEDMGVRVLLNTPVTDITEENVHFSEDAIETPNIIWAAGVAASPLLKNLETDQDRSGRVKVMPDLTVQGNDNIFVIGDAAYYEQEDQPLPAIAPVANQMGDYVAKVIKNGIEKDDRKAFHYLDKGNMATIGRAKAVADIRGLKFKGFFAWFLWSAIHIFFLIGFRNRFKVFIEWVWYYFTYKRGVRLITERE